MLATFCSCFGIDHSGVVCLLLTWNRFFKNRTPNGEADFDKKIAYLEIILLLFQIWKLMKEFPMITVSSSYTNKNC